MPLKVPTLPENPLLARRYAPLGNTFLNWAGSDEGITTDADEADVIDAWELQSMRLGRYTFDIAPFGPSELASRFPSWEHLGALHQSQIERLSFDKESNSSDKLEFITGPNLQPTDFEGVEREDDSSPAIEREPCLARYGRMLRVNSFQQSLDSRWTMEEEDIDESCDQQPRWSFMLVPNDVDPSPPTRNYTTFDPWQDYDEVDNRQPSLEELQRQRILRHDSLDEIQRQRVHVNDRTHTPNAHQPVRLPLSQAMMFSQLQRNQQTPQTPNLRQEAQRLPEAFVAKVAGQRQTTTPMTLPTEGRLLAQEATNANPRNVPTKPITTLMIRNIPTWYTQDMLLNEWPNEGTYNLLYLPFCFRTKKNLAFAFVNFTLPEHAEAFRLRWHKKGLQNHTSRKFLDVSVADVQGQTETLHKLTKQKCRIRNSHYQPVIYVDGIRVTVDDYLAMVATEALME
jgi:hypothetical protein